MSLFEVGKKYFIERGPVDGCTTETISVVAIDGDWIKVTDRDGRNEHMINCASPYIFTAKDVTDLDHRAAKSTIMFFGDDD